MIQIVCYSNSSRTVAFRTHYGHAYQVCYNAKTSPLIYYTFLYLLLYQKWGHLGPFGDSTLVGPSQTPSSEAHPFPVILQFNPYSWMSFTAVVSANCYLIQYINSTVITEYL